MTAKQYLRQIKHLDEMVDAKLEQVHKLRSLAESVTSTLSSDNVQSSQTHDKMAENITKIIDLENDINRMVDELIDLKAEAIKLIGMVPSEDCRLVLFLRYINFYTWEKIAVTIPCAYRTTHYIHGRALIEFEEVLKEHKKIA